MDLILWRHAEAEDGLPDSTRKLTARGLKQAQIMAGWLKPRLPKNARVIVSPAQRTRQTAEALGGDYETLKEIGTGASVKTILAASDWPDAKGAVVVVVGHQPTLGEVAAALMGGDPAGCNIKKGAIWWFSYKVKAGAAETVLRAVMSPDMV